MNELRQFRSGKELFDVLSNHTLHCTRCVHDQDNATRYQTCVRHPDACSVQRAHSDL